MTYMIFTGIALGSLSTFGPIDTVAIDMQPMVEVSPLAQSQEAASFIVVAQVIQPENPDFIDPTLQVPPPPNRPADLVTDVEPVQDEGVLAEQAVPVPVRPVRQKTSTSPKLRPNWAIGVYR